MPNAFPDTRFLCLTLGLVALAGCGGGGRPEEPSSQRNTALSCQRSEALLAERFDCRSDEQCPCGASCQNGQCTAGCRSDTECAAGETCDNFGRCSSGPTASAPRVAPAALTLSESLFEVVDVAEPRTVVVTFQGGPARKVRITTEPGATVQCHGRDFVAECILEPATRTEVKLKLDDTVAVDSGRTVRFFADPERATVSLRRAPPEAPVVGAPQPGRYQGLLRLLAPADAVSAPLARLSGVGVPVTASIFGAGGGSFVASLEGPGFFPGTTFTIARNGQQGFTVSVPGRRYAADGTVLVSAPGSQARFDATTLDVELALPFEGPAAAGLLATRWRLVLNRLGNLEPGAASPTVAAAEQLVPLATRLDTESDWLAGLRRLAVDSTAQLTSDTAEAQLLDPTVREQSLLSCFTDTNAFARQASRQICVERTLGQDQLSGTSLLALCDVPGNSVPLDAVPCASEVSRGFVDSSRVYHEVTPFGPSSDHCAELARTAGCSVVDATPTQPVFETLSFEENALYTRRYRVTRYCRFPTGSFAPPSHCAQLSACGRGELSLQSTQLSAQVGADGELLCRDGQPQGIFPLFETGNGTALAGADLIRVCGDELDRTASAQLAEIFGSASCIDRGRFQVALEQSLAADRARAAGSAQAADPAASALGHRLLQRWIDLHGVIVREALEAQRLQDTLGTTDLTDATIAALERSLSGWQQLFDARQSAALLAMPVEVLRNPDPRPRLRADAVLPSDRDDTHNVGLSVGILATLTAQLETVDFLVERGWYEGTPERRYALAQNTLRHAVVGLTLASELARRARSGGPDLFWQRHLDGATSDFVLAYRRLVDRLDLISQGKNPIGIDDADLPLYFAGDLADPSRRFSAVSDYLVGQGAQSGAWLPQAIAAAQTALQAATSEWSYRVDKQLTSERRLDDITRRYGELITGYCGAPINDPGFDVSSYNVLDRPLDTQTCFLEPSCRARPEDFVGRLSVAGLGEQLCVATRLRQAYGNSFTYGDEQIDAAITRLAPALSSESLAGGIFPLKIVDVQVAVNERSVTVEVAGSSPLQVVIPLDAVGALDARPPAGFDPKVLSAIQASCGQVRDRTAELRSTGSAPATCRFADDCPRGQSCLESSCQADATSDRLDRVDCYFDGAISEQALAVRSATNNVAIARAEANQLADRYQIAMRSCTIFQESNAAIQSWTDDLNETLTKLSIARVSMDALAHVAAAQKEALSADGIFTGGAAVIPGVVETAALIASDVLGQQMEETQRAHDAQVQRRQMQAEEQACVNDAALELVGTKAAALRITKSMQDLAQITIKLRGQKSYTAALWQEGRIALDNERQLLARSSTEQFWLNDKVLTYQNKLRQARRVAYLAVRAVEYEYQASLLLRHSVIAARRPADLDAVMTQLTAATGTRTVGGSRPSSLSTVVSLRSQILQLRDRSQDPPGWQTLSEAERFRLYVAQPGFAVHDDEGAYQGQRVPFSLVPFGSEGLGQSTGIPVLAGSDCAERLWSVNASILGNQVVPADSGTSSRIELWKSNTFYSQWCSPSADGPRYQVESVRPSVNLLQEPGAIASGGPGASRRTEEYSRARIQAYHNVGRCEFEAGEYGQGSTSELAARGLFGDYALFFPASTLKSGRPEGLDLGRVDDILLRLDYVSVARSLTP